MSKYYVYGSGTSGCLYDSGPHCSETKEQAIESLLETFEDLSKAELKRTRENLTKNGIHYFSSAKKAGASVAKSEDCTEAM